MIRITAALGMIALSFATTGLLEAQSGPMSSQPHEIAPIGVVGAQLGTPDTWALSYRYQRTYMGGTFIGMTEVTAPSVLANFFFAPLDLTATTHTAAVAFAPSERLTIMAAVDVIGLSMDHVTRQNRNYTAVSSGLGDATLGALLSLTRGGTTGAHISALVSIPTGSIDQTGVHPLSGGVEAQEPYVLQLGSGTVDIKPGITLTGTVNSISSWGLQASGAVRLGANARGYALGNTIETTAWLAIEPLTGLSFSGRVLAKNWAKIHGHDASYDDRNLSPTVREELSGGTRVDIPVGLSYVFSAGVLEGHRLAAELQIPVYQDLNGPQLGTRWALTVGWQKSFR